MHTWIWSEPLFILLSLGGCALLAAFLERPSASGFWSAAAMAGLRPVAEVMYIDFSALAMDQIVNQAAKARYMFGGQAQVPLVIRTQGGGGRGNAAQHSQSLEMWYVHIPGLVVIQPATPRDAKGLLKSAIRNNQPVIFIEHKLLYNTKGLVPDGEYTLSIGVADIKRAGKDVTVVAHSRMVLFAMQAAHFAPSTAPRFLPLYCPQPLAA